MSDAIANAAKLLAEPARAAILLKLMGGRAVPAGELATAAHVSPPTVSEHLARLTEAGFVTARRQGRHRFYVLANEDIAHVVESLLMLSASREERSTDAVTPALGSLEHARTCYAHLAGWLGAAVADALQREGYLELSTRKAFNVTARGKLWFEQVGIVVPLGAEANPRFARPCADWTERRPHLAGTLGVSLYRRFVELGWIAPSGQSRVLRVPLEGRQAFQRHLRIVVG